MDIQAILSLADLGTTAILLAILFVLWQEFKEQNKFIREQLLHAEAERLVLAEALGIQPSQLQAMAAKNRARAEAARLN